jgi:MFS family permease
MTVLILLIVAATLGLAFAAYKHPAAYRVMFIFVVPVLVMGGFVVLMIKIGDLNASVKSISNELDHIHKDAISAQLSYQIRSLNADRQFLKKFLIYYISGFAYLVFLMFVPDLLNLAKGSHRALRDMDRM